MPNASVRVLRSSGILMDVLFVAASIAAMFGVELMPRPVNAFAILCLYLLFLFLYRYVFKHDIGSGARPLLVQSNIRLPGFVSGISNYLFALIMLSFPGYLVVVCVAAITPEFSFDGWPAPVKLVLGIVCVALLIINAVIFGANSGRGKKRSENKQAATLNQSTIISLIIPLAALAAGLAAGSLENAWAVFSQDPGLELTLVLTTFVPFRYLVMRTSGVSRLSFISFLATVIFAVGRMVYQVAVH